MKDVFIFSSPYIIRTMLYDMAYVLNQPIHTVYILSEIVNQSETFDLLNIPNITVVDSLEDGLALCDSVIIVREETLCSQSIDFILNYVVANGKRCIDLPNPLDSTVVLDKNDGELGHNKDLPTILVIENGDYTQTYYTEMLLLHELLRHELKIQIRPSVFTATIYSALHKSMCLNPALHSVAQEEADILVYTVKKNPFLHSDIANLSQTIDLLNPDFIVMTTNDEFVQSDELYRWFEIIYGHRLNILVKSQYIVGKHSDTIRFPMYKSTHTEAPYNCINQHNFLVQKLFAAVSVPDGVSVINMKN